MRISDWSSDVCSSELPDADDRRAVRLDGGLHRGVRRGAGGGARLGGRRPEPAAGAAGRGGRPGAYWRRDSLTVKGLRPSMSKKVVPKGVRRTWTMAPKIGRAHVCTPVTNAHPVFRLLVEKKK